MERRFRKIAIKLIPAKESCPKCGGKMKQVINGYVCENKDWSLILKEGKVKWYDKAIMWINGYKMVGGAIIWGVGSIAGLPWLVIIGKAITYGGGAHKVIKLTGKVKNKVSAQKGKNVDWLEIIKSIIEFIKQLFSKGGK